MFAQFAPFALTPSSFPRSEFRKAVEMQPILNELTHRVAHDAEFLRESLASTLPVDPFTAELFRIWETVSAEGVAQVRPLRRRFGFGPLSLIRRLSASTRFEISLETVLRVAY